MHRNKAVATAPEVPVIQYSSNHTKREVGKGRFAAFVGFYSEKGRDEEFDGILGDLRVDVITVQHTREGQSPAIKQHWYFGEEIVFYPITNGPPGLSIKDCRRMATRTAEAGLGLAWPLGGRSRMAVRGFLRLPDGTPFLTQLSVHSTMTDHLLAALLDHVRVAEVADSMIKRTNHPDEVLPHELAWRLVAGSEHSAGRQATSQIIPFISGHPETVTREYVISIWRSAGLHEAAVQAWESILEWSQGYGVEEEAV
jgi:hypothetical protein